MQESIVPAIKRSLMERPWWKDVQSDVRTNLEWVIDNIEEVGTLFIRAYMTMFRWEFERRKLKGENINTPMVGYLSAALGMNISEESYQCGILPTRSVLDLYDYVRPNDADVSACLLLCHKIEVLEGMGVLTHNTEGMQITSSALAGSMNSGESKPRQPEHPITEETVKWDTPDEDE